MPFVIKLDSCCSIPHFEVFSQLERKRNMKNNKLFHTSFRGVFTAKWDRWSIPRAAVPYLISRCFHSVQQKQQIVLNRCSIPHFEVFSQRCHSCRSLWHGLFHTSFRGVFTAARDRDTKGCLAVPYLISRCFHSPFVGWFNLFRAVPYLISRCFHSIFLKFSPQLAAVPYLISRCFHSVRRLIVVNNTAVPYLISRCFHSGHRWVPRYCEAVPYLISRCFHSVSATHKSQFDAVPYLISRCFHSVFDYTIAFRISCSIPHFEVFSQQQNKLALSWLSCSIPHFEVFSQPSS